MKKRFTYGGANQDVRLHLDLLIDPTVKSSSITNVTNADIGNAKLVLGYGRPWIILMDSSEFPLTHSLTRSYSLTHSLTHSGILFGKNLFFRKI